MNLRESRLPFDSSTYWEDIIDHMPDLDMITYLNTYVPTYTYLTYLAT